MLTAQAWPSEFESQYHVLYPVHGRKQRQEGGLERGEKKERKKRGMERRRERGLKSIKERCIAKP